MADMRGEARLGAEVLGYSHPGCFAKRGCKLLILKGDDSKKSAKRLQLPECKDLSLAGRLRRRLSVELTWRKLSYQYTVCQAVLLG